MKTNPDPVQDPRFADVVARLRAQAAPEPSADFTERTLARARQPVARRAGWADILLRAAAALAVLGGVDAQSAEMLTAIRAVFPTTLAAVSFLLFILLYMPCVAAYAAMRREMESGRVAFATVFSQTALAWVVATAVYQVGRLLGLG